MIFLNYETSHDEITSRQFNSRWNYFQWNSPWSNFRTMILLPYRITRIKISQNETFPRWNSLTIYCFKTNLPRWNDHRDYFSFWDNFIVLILESSQMILSLWDCPELAFILWVALIRVEIFLCGNLGKNWLGRNFWDFPNWQFTVPPPSILVKMR